MRTTGMWCALVMCLMACAAPVVKQGSATPEFAESMGSQAAMAAGVQGAAMAPIPAGMGIGAAGAAADPAMAPDPSAPVDPMPGTAGRGASGTGGSSGAGTGGVGSGTGGMGGTGAGTGGTGTGGTGGGTGGAGGTGGSSGGCKTDADCVDSDPCSADHCYPDGTCHHPAVDCNDNDPCTDDTCMEPSGACTHTANARICSSKATGSWLTGMCHNDDVCCTGCWDGAWCDAGTSIAACGKAGNACLSCDDANPCTADACGASGACTHTNLPNAVTCTLGGKTGTCQTGTCVPTGPPPPCGGAGQACCPAATRCTGALTCTSGTCQTCGGKNEACCAGNKCEDNRSLACLGTSPSDPTLTCQCGAEFQACCSGYQCNDSNLACNKSGSDWPAVGTCYRWLP
jgi:hypothetical protein